MDVILCLFNNTLQINIYQSTCEGAIQYNTIFIHFMTRTLKYVNKI